VSPRPPPGLTGMTMTTRVLSVSVPVADQDAALAFYTGVLGCVLRHDVEVWPGVRMVEVVPPGSDVGLVLLPPDSPLPLAVRMGTSDADAAYAVLRDVPGVVHHNEEVLRWEGVPPMFSFTDPDGNGLVYLEDTGPRGETAGG
jgi:catechol 2,3-dioxygenase-like lactoylglutathione lyase family enzyme